MCVFSQRKQTHSEFLPQVGEINISCLKLQNAVNSLILMRKHLYNAYKEFWWQTILVMLIQRLVHFIFLHLQPPKSSWQHLTLNSNESSHFSSLNVSGRQSCGTMPEVNQIPVMVLTSGWGQGLWLEGARRGQPIGWEVSALKETKVMGSRGKCNGYAATKVVRVKSSIPQQKDTQVGTHNHNTHTQRGRKTQTSTEWSERVKQKYVCVHFFEFVWKFCFDWY